MLFQSRKATGPVASFFILAFLALSGDFSLAATKKNKETPAEIVQKAHNLILQKNRAQALSLLVEALKNERGNGPAFKEIKRNLTEISRVFMGDKAQQFYELSLSLKRADPAQAAIKINEALRMEPENFTLILEAARQALTKGDCKAADETIQKAQKMNPWDDETNLVMAQVKICQNDLPGYVMIKEGYFSNTFPWWSLEIEKNIREKNALKAKEVLVQLKKTDKNYPEQHYWTWKIDNEQKLVNLAAAQQYKTECQNLTVVLYRKFILDPRLCGRLAEVETFIKSHPQNP